MHPGWMKEAKRRPFPHPGCIADSISVSKKDVLTRSMQGEGFILHGKAAEMIFLRFAPKNRPARPAKPVDTMKNEGLAALHCILLYV